MGNYEQIEARPVEWLLKDFIPLSMLTLIVGGAGEGKSFLTTRLASMVSNEGNIFRNENIPSGKIILANFDDNPSQIIKPRLEMNGANMAQIYDMSTITLDSIRELRGVLDVLPNCRLIIFDPVSAFLREVGENNNQRVRDVMEQLKQVAEDYGAAIVLVGCYSKGLGSQALASFRSVWSVTNNKDTNIRTVACTKMNLTKNRQGFTFEIVDGKVKILNEYVDVNDFSSADCTD
jgi:RecA-family ATPase